MTSPISYVPEIGDHVYVGPAEDGKVHWVITSFLSPTIVMLESPMSGRRQHAPTRSLTLHTKGSPEPTVVSAEAQALAKRKPGRPRKGQA